MEAMGRVSEAGGFTLCQETGSPAEDGACRVHGGDNCLLKYVPAARLEGEEVVAEELESVLPEVPPEDWSPRDAFGDPQGYGDLVDDVDITNRGDVHAHGFAEGQWRLVWEIRSLVRRREGDDDPE